MMKTMLAGAVVVLAVLFSHRVEAQDIFNDVFREAVDEVRLQQDYRALQRDIANGNSIGAQYDMMRIQQDSANLARDQMQLNYDLNRVGSYPAYQNYYGYYNVNSAGQMLYYSPNQQISVQMSPLANQLAPGTAFVPANPIPGVAQTVRISNPDSTGVTLSFVFGGKTYSVESGRTEEFTVSAPTLIVFSRGGQAGVARYTLTGGSTFEFRSDAAGWSMVRKQPESSVKTMDGAPQNPVPRPTALPATAPGPGPLVPQP